MRVTNTITCLLLIFICKYKSVESHFYEKDPCGAARDNPCGSELECTCRTYSLACVIYPPLVIFDSTTGAISGGDVDIMRKICEYGDKLCEFSQTSFPECVDTKFNAQILDNEWYDACVGPVNNPENRYKYAFADIGYTDFTNPHIMVRPGSGITLSKLSDPTHDYNLGWMPSPELIINNALDAYREAGYHVKENNVILFEGDLNPTTKRLLDALDCGEIDFVITHPESAIGRGFLSLAELDVDMSRTSSFMVRKDEKCLLNWYNEAYNKFICSDEYPAFCQNLTVTYGGIFDFCQDPEKICHM